MPTILRHQGIDWAGAFWRPHGESIPCLSQFLKAPHILWLMTPYPLFKANGIPPSSLLLPPSYKGPLMTLGQPDNPGSTPVSRSLHGHLSGRHVILSTTLHNPMAAKPSSPPQHPTSLHLQCSKGKAKTNQFNYNMLYEAGAPPTLTRDLQAMPQPGPAQPLMLRGTRRGEHKEGRAQVRVRKGNKTGPVGPARASAYLVFAAQLAGSQCLSTRKAGQLCSDTCQVSGLIQLHIGVSADAVETEPVR